MREADRKKQESLLGPTLRLPQSSSFSSIFVLLHRKKACGQHSDWPAGAAAPFSPAVHTVTQTHPTEDGLCNHLAASPWKPELCRPNSTSPGRPGAAGLSLWDKVKAQ